MPRKAKDKVIENEVIEEKVEKTKTTKKADTAKKKKTSDEVEKKVTRKRKTAVKTAEDTVVVSSKEIEKTPVKKKATSKKKVEVIEEPVVKKKTKSTVVKKDDTSKEKTKSSTEKKSTTSKKKTEVATEKKSTTTRKKSETAPKKTSTTKKSTATKKATTAKKSSTSKKSSSTKSTKKSTKSEQPPIQIVEYYDLPYKYGNTLVKLLAQTPKTLFVYWEISEVDIQNFKKEYGENFFNITKPVLIVHNLTLNKTTEIEINDFASCWYLNTEDSDCKFDIELARKFINTNNTIPNSRDNNYLFIAKSNDLLAPNDHILFENLGEFITFTDTSTGDNINKNIKSFSFLKDLYDFYKNMYKDEILNNPSSTFNY